MMIIVSRYKMVNLIGEEYDHHHHYHHHDHHYCLRYKMINLVGDGTYGLVYLAYNQENKEKVVQYD